MNEKYDFFKDSSAKWYILGALIAIEILVSVSYIGYIHIEPISITLAYIPILITGILMDPVASTVVGTVFGGISLWKASASYVMAGDRIFSPFMSGSPCKSILLSIGTRAVFGFIVGLLYDLAKRHSRCPDFWIGVISFWGKTLHSFLVYGCMALLFPEMGFGIADTLHGFFHLDNLITVIGTTIIALLIRRALCTRPYLLFAQRMHMFKTLRASQPSFNLAIPISILIEFCLTCAVTVYFVGRTRYMLEQDGVTVSSTILSDLFLLQAQFLLGILALMFLLIVFQVFHRRYTICVEYEARLDTLTGVWNRKSFFQKGRQTLSGMSRQGAWHGYFIMVDIDWFKQINDTLGHPEGDRVLRDVAKDLQAVFAPFGLIGRLGGDEFAILIDHPISRDKLESELHSFSARIDKRSNPASSVSCSIGVLAITRPTSVESLYRQADRLLYQAKQQGRSRFIFGE